MKIQDGADEILFALSLNVVYFYSNLIIFSLFIKLTGLGCRKKELTSNKMNQTHVQLVAVCGWVIIWVGEGCDIAGNDDYARK